MLGMQTKWEGVGGRGIQKAIHPSHAIPKHLFLAYLLCYCEALIAGVGGLFKIGMPKQGGIMDIQFIV